MTNQPDTPPPDRLPDPAQPWSTPSGDPLSEPYQPPQAYQPPPAQQPPQASGGYAPGQAPIPQPAYAPTSQFPTTPAAPNQAPPGYGPDYGHGQAAGYGQAPGYPPPAYPGAPGYAQPPGPPPRKSNAPIIAVILAVTLLLCGGVATAGVLIVKRVKDKANETISSLPDLPTEVPALPTDVPDLPGLPTGLPADPGGTGRQVTVTYEVTGDGPASIVYIEKLGGSPVRLDNVKLPWKFTTKTQTPTVVSVIAMRIASTDGKISCRALVDNDEVKKSTSGNGNFATTSCTYFAVD